MKIALCQLYSSVGNFDNNLKQIKELALNSDFTYVDLFLFPGLFLPGLPPKGLSEKRWFTKQQEEAIERLAEFSKTLSSKMFILGIYSPSTLHQEGSIIIQDGTVTYYNENQTNTIAEKHIQIVPLNLLQQIQSNHQKQTSLTDVIICLAANPFEAEPLKPYFRIVSEVAEHLKKRTILINATGLYNERIYDGGSVIANANGDIEAQLPYLQEKVQIIDTEVHNEPQYSGRVDSSTALYNALIMGIQFFCKNNAIAKAYVLLTGGIDSSVTAALLVAALGSENVTAIITQTGDGIENSEALQLIKKLKITHKTISPEGISNRLLSQWDEQSNKNSELPPHFIERITTSLITTITEKNEGALFSSVNKSELAVGSCTLYGNMSGSLSVLGDVYKTDVYRLAYYINREKEVIPVQTINNKSSIDELYDEDNPNSLPLCDELDIILKLLLDDEKSSKEVIQQGYNEATVTSVLHALKQNEYKRRQFAPVLQVSDSAFEKGKQLPLRDTYEW